jgi:hypothetical protein
MGNISIQTLVVNEGPLRHDPAAVVAAGEQLLELDWREANPAERVQVQQEL